MKVFLILATLISSSFAFAAGDIQSIDCDRGVDPGKFCQSQVGACVRPSCDAAVSCMAQLVHEHFAGEKVTVHIANSQVTDVIRDGEPRTRFPVQTAKANCNGKECVTPMIVFTRIIPEAFIAKVGQCEPTALLIIGDSKIDLLSMVASAKPVAVAVTTPRLEVVTVLTYLLPEPPVVCSQPQPLAATDRAELEAV